MEIIRAGRGEKQGLAATGKEHVLRASDLIIATNFLYKDYQPLAKGQQRHPADTDGIRGDLAIALLHNAAPQGVRVVAADGGSSPAFLSTIEHLQEQGLTLVRSEVAGRAPQRRSAFAAAIELADGKAIVYTQPEKLSLLDHLYEVSKPILDGTADIVIPTRNPKLFEETYPDYMRESEIRVNATYNRFLHRENLMPEDENFDWFFGPVVFKSDPEINELFLARYRVKDAPANEKAIKSRNPHATADPEKNSGSHYFPVIHALFLGKPVVSVEIPFVYPQTQRENELSSDMRGAFYMRRLADADAYRLEMLHFLAFLRGNPRSQIEKTS